jgi:hypothetical protein
MGRSDDVTPLLRALAVPLRAAARARARNKTEASKGTANDKIIGITTSFEPSA